VTLGACASISRLLKNIRLFLAKEPYTWDYILQKRPEIWRSLLIATNGCATITVDALEHTCTRDITHDTLHMMHYARRITHHTQHMTQDNTWHITHLYAWHHAFICVTSSIHTCDMRRVTWCIHTCDMMHSYVWHDTLTPVLWRIYSRQHGSLWWAF